MTRAEAIEILKKLIEAMQGHVTVLPTPERIAAIRLAIASLETNEAYQLEYEKPTTKNDLAVDCISRDEVCRYVAEFVNHEFSTREEEELIDNIITGIERMPSVTPQEPRRGHWIECMPGGAEEWCYKCSECDFWKYKKTINLNKFKFCPNCGASMVEPQESEDKG